jgi:hypothetical protein
MAQRGRWLGGLSLLTQLATNHSRLKRDGEKMPPLHREFCLQNLYVFSLPALGAALYVEADCLAFLQRTVTVRLDRREVNENVFAVLP